MWDAGNLKRKFKISKGQYVMAKCGSLLISGKKRKNMYAKHLSNKVVERSNVVPVHGEVKQRKARYYSVICLTLQHDV